MAQPRCFQVGDAFSSYEDLKKHVEEFERANFIQLAHRDSRTLTAAAKRAPLRSWKRLTKSCYIIRLYLLAYLVGKKQE